MSITTVTYASYETDVTSESFTIPVDPDGRFKIERNYDTVFVTPLEITGVIDRIDFIYVLSDGDESNACSYDMDIFRMAVEFTFYDEHYLENGTRIYGEGNGSDKILI